MQQEKKSFHFSIRVYYEDTDAGGIVYHSQYLNFMERARTEWLRSMGFHQDRLTQEEGILFVVCSISIDYRKPAFFDQLLDIQTVLDNTKATSLIFKQSVINGSEQTICQATVKIACISTTTRKSTLIPTTILSELY